LAHDGYVHVRHGRGSFVRELVLDYALQRRTRLTQNLADTGERARRELLSSAVTTASSWARALGVAASSPVEVLTTCARVRGRPVGLSTAAFPLPRLSGIAQEFEQTRSITAALAALGVPDYTRARSVVSARLPTAAQADVLARPATQPVLVVEYTNIDGDGIPVEAGRTLFAADAIQLTVEPDDGADA